MNEFLGKKLVALFFVAIAILSLLITIRNNQNAHLTVVGSKANPYSGGIENLNPLERNIITILRNISVPDSAIQSTFMLETESREIAVLVPKGKPMEEIIHALQPALQKTQYLLEDSYYSSKTDNARLIYRSSKKNEEDILLHLRRARKGYFRNNASISFIISGLDTTAPEIRNRFLTFQEPLTYRIDSWSPHLDSIAKVLDLYEMPYILHIPMESKRNNRVTPFSLRIDDSRNAIDAKLNDLMRHAPSTMGTIASDGDLFLENSAVTDHFFATLKRRRLIFIDTRKHRTKKAEQIAYSHSVPYIGSLYMIHGGSGDSYGVHLRKMADRAALRKEIIVQAEASEMMISALESNGEYFEQLGVSISTLPHINK